MVDTSASSQPAVHLAHPRDPWGWCIGIPLAFGLIAAIRLTVPATPYFDEVHYVPAARAILEWWQTGTGAFLNREHPMLGKELIALGMGLFGDGPLGWRIMPLVAGVVAVGASMRAMWHASLDRFATVAFGVLLVTGFHLLIHARIAMLDTFMVAFLALAAWQSAAAIREPETGRWRLAFTGVFIGCALASKWNAVPLAIVFGLTFFAARLAAGRRRLFTSRRGSPVPGISLMEAAIWLGVVPLAVYAFTFAPAYWPGGALGTLLDPSPFETGGMIAAHREMLDLQQQVKTPHTYQSTWPQWVLNTRAIWYLYEPVDGVQRGVMLIGNPLTMLLGLPALMWCLVVGLARMDWPRLAMVVGYGVTLGLWVIAPKPVQFYYHYVMPGIFLLGALAFALSDLRRAGRERIAYGVLAASAALFALFFPILTAGALDNPMSFANWAWIEGWR